MHPKFTKHPLWLALDFYPTGTLQEREEKVLIHTQTLAQDLIPQYRPTGVDLILARSCKFHPWQVPSQFYMRRDCAAYLTRGVLDLGYPLPKTIEVLTDTLIHSTLDMDPSPSSGIPYALSHPQVRSLSAMEDFYIRMTAPPPNDVADLHRIYSLLALLTIYPSRAGELIHRLQAIYVNPDIYARHLSQAPEVSTPEWLEFVKIPQLRPWLFRAPPPLTNADYAALATDPTLAPWLFPLLAKKSAGFSR